MCSSELQQEIKPSAVRKLDFGSENLENSACQRSSFPEEGTKTWITTRKGRKSEGLLVVHSSRNKREASVVGNVCSKCNVPTSQQTHKRCKDIFDVTSPFSHQKNQRRRSQSNNSGSEPRALETARARLTLTNSSDYVLDSTEKKTSDTFVEDTSVGCSQDSWIENTPTKSPGKDKRWKRKCLKSPVFNFPKKKFQNTRKSPCLHREGELLHSTNFWKVDSTSSCHLLGIPGNVNDTGLNLVNKFTTTDCELDGKHSFSPSSVQSRHNSLGIDDKYVECIVPGASSLILNSPLENDFIATTPCNDSRPTKQNSPVFKFSFPIHRSKSKTTLEPFVDSEDISPNVQSDKIYKKPSPGKPVLNHDSKKLVMIKAKSQFARSNANLNVGNNSPSNKLSCDYIACSPKHGTGTFKNITGKRLRKLDDGDLNKSIVKKLDFNDVISEVTKNINLTKAKDILLLEGAGKLGTSYDQTPTKKVPKMKPPGDSPVFQRHFAQIPTRLYCNDIKDTFKMKCSKRDRESQQGLSSDLSSRTSSNYYGPIATKLTNNCTIFAPTTNSRDFNDPQCSPVFKLQCVRRKSRKISPIKTKEELTENRIKLFSNKNGTNIETIQSRCSNLSLPSILKRSKSDEASHTSKKKSFRRNVSPRCKTIKGSSFTDEISLSCDFIECTSAESFQTSIKPQKNSLPLKPTVVSSTIRQADLNSHKNKSLYSNSNEQVSHRVEKSVGVFNASPPVSPIMKNIEDVKQISPNLNLRDNTQDTKEAHSSYEFFKSPKTPKFKKAKGELPLLSPVFKLKIGTSKWKRNKDNATNFYFNGDLNCDKSPLRLKEKVACENESEITEVERSFKNPDKKSSDMSEKFNVEQPDVSFFRSDSSNAIFNKTKLFSRAVAGGNIESRKPQSSTDDSTDIQQCSSSPPLFKNVAKSPEVIAPPYFLPPEISRNKKLQHKGARIIRLESDSLFVAPTSTAVEVCTMKGEEQKTCNPVVLPNLGLVPKNLATQAIDEFDTEKIHLEPESTKFVKSGLKLEPTLSSALVSHKNILSESPSKENKTTVGKSWKRQKRGMGPLQTELDSFIRKNESEQRVRLYEKEKGDVPLDNFAKDFRVLEVWNKQFPLRVYALDDDGLALVIINKGVVKSKDSIYPGCWLKIYPPWTEMKTAFGGVKTYISIFTCDVTHDKVVDLRKAVTNQWTNADSFIENPDLFIHALLGC